MSVTQGVLEIDSHGGGYLRTAEANFLPTPRDVRVPARLIEELQLQNGHYLAGMSERTRSSRRSGKRGGGGSNSNLELTVVETINGHPTQNLPDIRPFSELVSEHPCQSLRLSRGGDEPLSLRVIDLIAPIGRGQRGLIVAAPKTGKTILLEQIGHAIAENYPDVHLIVLLVDERPEEVTHMRRTINGEVIASSADSTSANHIRMARLMLDRARRLVETLPGNFSAG